MQLNFISNLNALFEVSIGTSRSLFKINSRVIEQLLENNQTLLHTAIAANGEMLDGSKAKFSQFAIQCENGGKLAAEFLESGKTAGQILTNSRERYESWAVESAGQLGKAAGSLTLGFKRKN